MLLSHLLPIGTRVRCAVTDLGDGTITGHILSDGPYRVRFDDSEYEEDPTDAHHRAHDQLEVISRPQRRTA